MTQPNSDTNEPTGNHASKPEQGRLSELPKGDNEPMTVEQLLLSAYYRGKDKKAYSDAELKADTTQINALIRKVCEEVIGRSFRKNKNTNGYRRGIGNGDWEAAPEGWAKVVNAEHKLQRAKLQQLLQKGDK